MLGVAFHPDAYKELEQAQFWDEEQAVGVGRRFLIHRFPFAIIYRHVENVIQVVAVMHLKRKPGYWKQRIF